VKFGEDPNHESAEDVNPESNILIPVNFNTDHKTMLSYIYNTVNKRYLAAPEKFDRQIISLRAATAKELTLDKDSCCNDSFDALRLALKMYQVAGQNYLVIKLG
jgi:hypothetical protein